MKLPIAYQRIEAFAILVASLYFYQHFHLNFILFAVLLFAFDLSMVGYVVSSKVGAHTYNLAHSLIGPSALLVFSAIYDSRIAVGLSLIWLAHIGLDRTLGYGLKFPSSFSETHLGHIGKEK